MAWKRGSSAFTSSVMRLYSLSSLSDPKERILERKFAI